MTRPSWFQRLRNHVMGEDVFVSYSRADANAYAFALAHALTRRKLACYLDQLGSPPGAEIPEEVLRKAERCQVFVLIATQGAKGSEAVSKEVKRFLGTRRALIPVNVDGALQEATWFPQLRGVAEARETGAVVKAGRPSEALLDRIETAVGYNRQSQRIRRAALMMVALMGLVIAASSIFSGVQLSRARSADDERKKAEKLRDEARSEAKEAADARADAMKAKAAAELAAENARKQEEKALRDAEAAQARGRALRLAAEAREQLPFDPKLSVQLAEAAVRASEPPVDEAVAVLRLALASDYEAAVLRRFPAAVVDIAVAPDGRSVAIASGHETVELVDLHGKRLCPPLGVKGEPKRLALSQGLLAAGGWGGLGLWDVRSCQRLHVPFGKTEIDHVQFAPDETLFAITHDHILHVRRASEWSALPLSRDGHPVNVTAISADGRLVVSAGHDGYLHVLRLPGGSPLKWRLPPVKGFPERLLLSPDSRVAALFRGTELQLISLTNPEEPRELYRLEDNGLYGAAFSPDGALLAIAGWNAPTRIVFVATGREVASLGPSTEPLKGVAFDSSGTLLVAYGLLGRIRLFSGRGAGDWGPLAELRGHSMEVPHAVFLPEGRRLLSAGDDGSVRLWNLALPEGTREELLSGGELEGARFSPEKGLLFTWGKDVRLYDAASGKLRELLEPRPDSAWVGAGLSKAGRLVGVNETGSVCDSGGTCQPLLQACERLNLAVPGPDGTWAGICYDDRVRSSSGRKMGGDDSAWQVLAFSPRADLLAVATKSQDGLLWRPRLGGEPSRLVGHSQLIRAFAFSPDGRRLLTGSWDDTARLWTVSGAAPGATLRPDRVLLGHDNGVEAVAFNRDGTQAVTASGDLSVRVWEAATGNPIQVLPLRIQLPLAVAFLPDGRIASVTKKGVLRVTPCELCGGVPGLLELARRHKAARLTAREVEAVAGDLGR